MSLAFLCHWPLLLSEKESEESLVVHRHRVQINHDLGRTFPPPHSKKVKSKCHNTACLSITNSCFPKKSYTNDICRMIISIIGHSAKASQDYFTDSSSSCEISTVIIILILQTKKLRLRAQVIFALCVMWPAWIQILIQRSCVFNHYPWLLPL